VSKPSTEAAADHPRLQALVARAQALAAQAGTAPRLGLVHPCDALAMQSAQALVEAGIAQPLLVGEREAMARAAGEAGIALSGFELVLAEGGGAGAARHAAMLAREGAVAALMKGSLHTDELMGAVVSREGGLRTQARISHAFVFDLPRYPKLLTLADCVVNIAPDLRTKLDIVGNAVTFLQRLGVPEPKVAVVAAVEAVNPQIPATLDAKALVEHAAQGRWPGAMVEGPFGFDNAISAEAARVKGLNSAVAGNADLLVMPDLNAGNMLYKSFVYIGGGECAGLVLGAKVPVVLTSRADSLLARVASAALAVLTAPA
jgi:phosphate acetyltransferase/phosphate butyryltransferase